MRFVTSGFTLAELLVCLAVLTVALGLGIPALTRLRNDALTITTVNSLTAALNAARMAAVTRRIPVSVCPTEDGRSCRGDLKWEGGWLVFQDPDRTGQPADSARILQAFGPLHPSLSVRSTVGRHRVRYQPTGLSGGTNLTLRVCRREDSKAVGEIVVNVAGRPRTRRFPNPEPTCPYAP